MFARGIGINRFYLYLLVCICRKQQPALQFAIVNQANQRLRNLARPHTNSSNRPVWSRNIRTHLQKRQMNSPNGIV